MGQVKNNLAPCHSSLATSFKVGSKVAHPQFGSGVVLQKEGSGENEKLTIFFRNAGKRKLSLKHVSLKKI